MTHVLDHLPIDNTGRLATPNRESASSRLRRWSLDAARHDWYKRDRERRFARRFGRARGDR
jgi:hypothetical protein